MSEPSRLGLGLGMNAHPHGSSVDEVPRNNSSNDLAAGKTERSPFIGIFWDIENCAIPPTKSVKDVIAFLRTKFVLDAKRREREFIVVCDIRKERTADELSQQQVNVVHIQARSKNMADDKLRSCMRKYFDLHNPGDYCLLISGDINFQETLMSGKFDKQLRIIVIHPGRANDSLVGAAVTDECYAFDDLMDQIPNANKKVFANNEFNNMLYIANLPHSFSCSHLERQIRLRTDMIGGRVMSVDPTKNLAIVKFANPDQTRRAFSLMRDEFIGGCRLRCSFHKRSDLQADQQRSSSENNMMATNSHHFQQGNGAWLDGHPVNQLANSVSQLHVSNVVKQQPRNHTASYSEALASCSPPDERSRFDAGVQVHPTSLQPFETTSRIEKSKTPGFFERYFTEETLKNISQQSTSEIRTGGDNDNNTRKVSVLKRGNSSSVELDSRNSPPTGTSTLTPDNSSGSDREDVSKSRQNSGGSHEHAEEGMTDLYILNLDSTYVEEPELYAKLLDKVEEITDSDNETLTIRQAPNNVTYAHLSVTTEEAVKLKELLNSVQFHGRVLTVTEKNPEVRLENPSEQVPVEMNRPVDSADNGQGVKDYGRSSNSLRWALIRIFGIMKKDDLPLITLLHTFEKEYDQALDLKTLRTMPDFLREEERDATKFVKLNPEAKVWNLEMEKKGCVEKLPLGYCSKHCPGGVTNGVWIKKFYSPLKLCYVVSGYFADTVTQLLKRHQDTLPLNSFLVCYEELHKDKLKEVAENDSTNSRSGVFLEHLLLSVPNVRIVKRPNGPRQLVLAGSSDTMMLDGNAGKSSGGFGASLVVKVREILEAQPRAAFSLLNLTNALRQCGILCDKRGDNPETVVTLLQQSSVDFEIIGFGAERVVTLNHTAQVRRFLTLVEQIRGLCDEQITENNIGALFEMAGQKKFDVLNFGVCEVGVLLDHVEDRPLTPQRNPEPEEPAYSLFRFGVESKNLLTKQPGYWEDFIRFPQKFRKLYGRELKVRNYGYEKLADLCEAVGEIVEVQPVPGTKDRRVVLKMEERYKHLKDVMDQIFKGKREMSQAAFKEEFKKIGWEFKPEVYGCEDLEEVLLNLRNLGSNIKLEQSRRKLVLVKCEENDVMEVDGTRTELNISVNNMMPVSSRDRNTDGKVNAEEPDPLSLQPSFSSSRLAVNFGQSP